MAALCTHSRRLPLNRIYAGLRIYTTTNQPLPLYPTSPAPIISRDDLESHLEVLREQGWHFRQASGRFNQLDRNATWWELRHSARFPSFKAAMGYVNDVAELAKSEKHHPTILIFDRVKVAISLDTHDTIERPAMVTNSPDSHTLMYQWPGITLRDVRMALLINPLFDRHKIVDRIMPADNLNPNYEELIRVHVEK